MAEPVDAAVVHAPARAEVQWAEAELDSGRVRPRVRVWAYAAPAVVLGISQRPTPADVQRAAAAGIDLLARQSGGGAVLAGPWMLGASVVLPARHALVEPGIAASFRWLGLAWVRWLDELGVRAEAVDSAARARDDPLAWACFAALSWWEVACDGAKIVGLAQARRRHGVLFSSAVLLAPPPWHSLCSVLGRPAADADALAARTTSCGARLGRAVETDCAAQRLCVRLADAVAAAAA